MTLERITEVAVSPLAYISYTIIVLTGLKMLGANLTWAMVFFPVWGLGVLLILLFAIVAIIIGAITK